MRVLIWHVHGSWTTAFVAGGHDYLLPVVPGRGPDGLGRARTWQWPEAAVEVPAARLRDTDFDVVVLQRPHELRLLAEWTGRRAGIDVPAVFVEHNAADGDVPNTRHPLADRSDVPIVHVTHFNQLFWDNGRAPSTVIEHGVLDPGDRFTGEIARAAVSVNEPVRRGRFVGTDLLAGFAEAAPLDVFGMRVGSLPDVVGVTGRIRGYEDLPQHRMHAEIARRRAYLHPVRWTSLGLSLLEAMHLGLPVVALATTEVSDAVPPQAGAVSTRVAVLRAALRDLTNDVERARVMGKAAREAALARYGVARFLADWDELLEEVTR